MVEKSKNYVVASRAAAALGEFETASRKHRHLILVELTRTLRKDLPSRPKRGHENRTTGDYIPGKQGAVGNARYSALSVAITAALNKLTGRHIQSYTEWMQMVKDNKRNLDVLFRNDA